MREQAAEEPAGVSEPAKQTSQETAQKKVFLVAAFRPESAAPNAAATGAPVPAGTAQDVVAVIGIAGEHRRFEWVGPSQEASIANPALVTPVPVRLALPSPWHPDRDGVMTGLVQLDHSQLGDGTVDDDLDALLGELGKSRGGS